MRRDLCLVAVLVALERDQARRNRQNKRRTRAWRRSLRDLQCSVPPDQPRSRSAPGPF
jgi:hypothetical protein